MSILILVFFSWIGITSAYVNPDGKTPVEKERLNILVICNKTLFFKCFNIFVIRLLGPADLLSFKDEIKLTISSELVGLR